MSKIKKLNCLLPIVGGIISLLVFMFPVWYSPSPWIEYIWINGRIRHVTAGDVLDWLPNEMFIPSIITTILIALSSALFIISAILDYRGRKVFIKNEHLWIILALLELSTLIGYILGIQNGFYSHTNMNFWSTYEIQAGLYLPFIGVGISVLGAVLGKILKRDIKKIE
ncbi:MAG: hypothetical protein ACFFCV_01155 [Promethearchaeota archaeon]